MSVDGGVDFIDASMQAAAVLRQTGLDAERQPDAVAVALKLGVHVRGVRTTVLGSRSMLSFRHGDPFVHVSEELDERSLQYHVAHELGHWTLWDRALVREREEEWCCAFAGALLAPHGFLSRAWEGAPTLSALCERFPLVPPTCLVLCLGERRIEDTFVFQRNGLRYARSSRDASSEVLDAAEWASRRGPLTRPGLRASRLPDAPERVAVVVTRAA